MSIKPQSSRPVRQTLLAVQLTRIPPASQMRRNKTSPPGRSLSQSIPGHRTVNVQFTVSQWNRDQVKLSLSVAMPTVCLTSQSVWTRVSLSSPIQWPLIIPAKFKSIGGERLIPAIPSHSTDTVSCNQFASVENNVRSTETVTDKTQQRVIVNATNSFLTQIDQRY